MPNHTYHPVGGNEDADVDYAGYADRARAKELGSSDQPGFQPGFRPGFRPAPGIHNTGGAGSVGSVVSRIGKVVLALVIAAVALMIAVVVTVIFGILHYQDQIDGVHQVENMACYPHTGDTYYTYETVSPFDFGPVGWVKRADQDVWHPIDKHGNVSEKELDGPGDGHAVSCEN